jgi:biopolymer transport protein ExbB
MRVVIYLVFLLIIPSTASAWWSDQWTYRMPVTITSSASNGVSEGAVDNAVLIKLHAGNFSDFFLVQESLADLRFVASDDKTPLKFQVDTFDLVNQLLFIWVNVPITTGGTPEKIWMYYGNANAVAPTDGEATFDATQAAVFHVQVAEPSLVDATAYKTKITVTAVEVVGASLIGAGLKFKGDGVLAIQDTPANLFDSAKGITFSAWLKPTALDVKPTSIFSRDDGKGNSLDVSADATGIFVQLVNAGESVKLQTQKSLTAGTWNHFALVIDKATVSVFINGEKIKSEAIKTLSLSGPINIGSKTTIGAGFIGEMDEIRLANAAISQGSLSIAAKNQGITDEIVTANASEQLGSESSEGGGGLVGVLFKNMDEFGWAVLIIMAIMAVISWIVMIGKALYIRRVMKDNSAFLKQYAKLVEVDPASLDKEDDEEAIAFSDAPIMQAVFGSHDHFQSSTIYHLYHRGINEIKSRTKTIQTSGLTARAANALRATLDAQLVREVQRLNSLMVLLTIAISGGPFIGLFGTVGGVMMTFAAIAKTGDVNIAAIAPGVAAALLTTLGGLFVAIPSLFGYNYLSSRIKDSVADMRVFNDEFVTRLAEYYGRN